MIFVLLFAATCFLAYANGAKDNFKGVASLFGSRTCSYRTAIAWATAMTFAGSIASIFLPQALLKKFSAKRHCARSPGWVGVFHSRRRGVLAVDEQANCAERYAGAFFGIGTQQLMDAAHFFSAGVVSFARGLNDTPKIVALLCCGRRSTFGGASQLSPR